MKNILGNKYINAAARDLLKIGGAALTTYETDNGYAQAVGITLALIGVLTGYIDKANNQPPVPATAILSNK